MWAALFPGQGSQQVGMGRFLFDNFKSAKERFEEAGDVLSLNFKKLCFDGPESDLVLTENTQPALLLVSTATFQVVRDIVGVKISAGAGHSIGEYAAVVNSGSMQFADGLRAVRTRGQAMQKAVPVGEGAMLAVIGLTDAQTERLCAWAEKETGKKPLEPANFNAPGQVIISGSAEIIDWVRANAKAELFVGKNPDGSPEPTPKMRLIPLNVSAPFHCSLMKPAENEMRSVLTTTKFGEASWPIVQNFNGEATQNPDVLREQLIRQVSGAVRWTQCMQVLKSRGTTGYIEFGAGKVLGGLAKKIDSEGPQTLNINSLEDLKNLEAAVLTVKS